MQYKLTGILLSEKEVTGLSWMEWLDDNTRKNLQFNLKHTLAAELSKRCWGVLRSEESCELNEYFITDMRGINLAMGLIRCTLKNSGARVIYRGQDRDYPLLPSLYRTCRNPEDMEILENRLDEVLDIISDEFYPEGAAWEREAVCQHYGMPTRFLDVADNLQTALWFAYDRTMVSKDREVLPTDDIGYINIIAVPNDMNEVKVVDLRNQPSRFLRLHTQQAFAMKKADPGKNNGLFASYNAAKFMVPRELLRLWSNHDNIPYEYMFPSEKLDEGLKCWEALKTKLKEKNIVIEKYLKLYLE